MIGDVGDLIRADPYGHQRAVAKTVLKFVLETVGIDPDQVDEWDELWEGWGWVS